MIQLYDFAGSPFCIKIRALLDYKRLDYERLNIVSPRFFELLRRNPARKVPAAVIDGRFVADSTDIALALEEHQPEPSILPDDPRLSADNLLLEAWADEAIYFIGLYYRWQEPEGRATAGSVFPRVLAGILATATGRSAREQLWAQGTGRRSPQQVADELERALDVVDARVATSAYLLGDTPYLCDFAVMGQLVYLVRTPYGERALAAHAPLMEYLERMKALRAGGQRAASQREGSVDAQPSRRAP